MYVYIYTLNTGQNLACIVFTFSLFIVLPTLSAHDNILCLLYMYVHIYIYIYLQTYTCVGVAIISWCFILCLMIITVCFKAVCMKCWTTANNRLHTTCVV